MSINNAFPQSVIDGGNRDVEGIADRNNGDS
jgi:hypothetical protein